MRWVLEIPGLPRLQSGVVSWRVRATERKKWRDLVAWSIRACGTPIPSRPLSQCVLEFTRYSTREPDDDNLRSSFKAARDGLIGILIDDDNPACVVRASYGWELAKRGKGRIRIEVRTLDEGKSCPECGQPID